MSSQTRCPTRRIVLSVVYWAAITCALILLVPAIPFILVADKIGDSRRV